MRPARLKGRSRKLSDLYIDAKVPRAARAAARVLVRTTTGAIVWAEHLGLADGESAELIPARSPGTF
jgi:tRNA(Ile)-lysidine synthetase-like protein